MNRPGPLILSLLVCLAVAPTAHSQFAPAPPPRLVPPPLLYLQLAGPKGMQATFYRGGEKRTVDTPCIIGVRPGYSFRLALHNIPDYPDEVFYPSLEVHGSLILGDKMKHIDFPAALNFNREDFWKASNGSTVKKAILLERPDAALPVASDKDVPIEIPVPPNRDPVWETRHLGVVLAVMQMGERKLEPRELINLPGTLLLPGEKSLFFPSYPPWVPWMCHAVYDPVHGPMPPSTMHALPDGGDTGLTAGVRRDGKIVGLDPTDTVGKYVDSKGVPRVAVSNRVALCVPRFLVAVGESTVGSHLVRIGLGGSTSKAGATPIGAFAGADVHAHRTGLDITGHKLRASGTAGEVGLAVTGLMNGLSVQATVRGAEHKNGTCPPPTLAGEPKDGPLHIIKWPDKTGGLVGAVITFFVKYNNTGSQPMSGIVIADSLHTRYEYVPGSAKSDRAATFSTQPNEAGSLILRWEIQGDLAPRDSGIVSFQVKIR